MILLVPVITEKAMAITHAIVKGTGDPAPCKFTRLSMKIETGLGISNPPPESGINSVSWNTMGGKFIYPSDERGSVTYKVSWGAKTGEVSFYFDNPATGKNSCKVQILSGPLHGSCFIEQGNVAHMMYTLAGK